jgi:hypothetical protein
MHGNDKIPAITGECPMRVPKIRMQNNRTPISESGHNSPSPARASNTLKEETACPKSAEQVMPVWVDYEGISVDIQREKKEKIQEFIENACGSYYQDHSVSPGKSPHRRFQTITEGAVPDPRHVCTRRTSGYYSQKIFLFHNRGGIINDFYGNVKC